MEQFILITANLLWFSSDILACIKILDFISVHTQIIRPIVFQTKAYKFNLPKALALLWVELSLIILLQHLIQLSLYHLNQCSHHLINANKLLIRLEQTVQQT